MQLARRVPALEPDPEVVQAQVQTFKTTVDDLIASMKGAGGKDDETPSEASTAKVLEELKVIVRDIPARIEKRLGDSDTRDRGRRSRRYHPLFLREMMAIPPDGAEDPMAPLVITSVFREDAPWLYELGREAYDSLHGRSRARRERALSSLRYALVLMYDRRVGMELCEGSEEAAMMFRESARFLEHTVERLRHLPEQS